MLVAPIRVGAGASTGAGYQFMWDFDGGTGGVLQRGHTFELAVGSMAHEFGHRLLLPDLYDLDYDLDPELGPVDDSGGIGYWGLMGHGNRGWGDAGGPNPFCVWSLGQLGWLGVDNEQLEILTDDLEGAVFADVNAGGKIYLLPEPDGPVMTTRLSRGMVTSMFWRLCSRAPLTTMFSRPMALRQGFKMGNRSAPTPTASAFRWYHA